MKSFIFSLILLAQLLLPAAHASVILSGTRFIFNGDQESISFRVLNQDEKDYLVLTKILGGNPAGQQAAAASHTVFIATPPLFQLKAKHENTVRITKVGGELPADRESLFWLSVASVPASTKDAQNNTVEIAVRNKMKLFYRPAGLKVDPATAYQKISLTRKNGVITIANPTPYYLTLVNVMVAGKRIDDVPMLPPFGRQDHRWCQGAGQCLIQWQSINDFGSQTPVQQQTVQ